jgi:hypothetical protein
MSRTKKLLILDLARHALPVIISVVVNHFDTRVTNGDKPDIVYEPPPPDEYLPLPNGINHDDEDYDLYG